jgi:uncharacterized membrane protein
VRLAAPRALGWSVIAVFVAAYAILAHYVSARGDAAELSTVGVAAAPYLVFALALAWRSRRRVLMLALCAAVAALLWRYADSLARDMVWVYFLQHVATNAMLAAVFGRTLGAGRQPLCARFAAMAHGELDERMARYTRQVTVAWTVFFAVTAVLSVLLFAAAPIAAWSVFANLLTLPLLGLMFAVEYAVRLRRLPDIRHVGILGTMRLYWRDSAKVAAPPAP